MNQQTNEEEERMKETLDICSMWLECGGTTKGERMFIRIWLKDGALNLPFLQLKLVNGNYCLIPVTRLIQVMFNTTQLALLFQEYDMQLLFAVSNSVELEMLVSQMRLIANISESIETSFPNSTREFLSRFTVPVQDIERLNMFDVFQTYCSASPITINNSPALKVWNNRSHYLNSSYFTKNVPMKVICLTWNMASQKPNPCIVSELVQMVDGVPDVVCFAFEEIDMSIKSVVSGNSATFYEWSSIIREFISASKFPLEIRKELSLGGVYAAVAVNKECNVTPINVIESKSVRLGTHGLTANKGGIFFTIECGQAKLSFICCHLSAHTENLDARNTELVALLQKAHHLSDYVFIVGDLNYRIDLSYDQVCDLIMSKRTEQILEFDQLKRTMRTNEEIGKLIEAPIQFDPTYKFDTGSDDYDTSAKRRVPSYTDRVLLKIMPARIAVGYESQFVFETDVIHHFAPPNMTFMTESCYSGLRAELTFPASPKTMEYSSGKSQFSDHRPVVCKYDFDIPIEIKEKVEKFDAFARKKRDEMSSITTPKLSVEENISQVHVTLNQNKIVIIENTGITWSRWTVTLIGQGASVFPMKGVLIPGEKTAITIAGQMKTKDPMFVIFNDNEKPLLTLEVYVDKQSLLNRLKIK